jgi:hypothetical protein
LVAENTQSFSLGFVRYGSTLLVDDRELGTHAQDLARAICFAIERKKHPSESHDFSWPPRGAPFMAAEARDAILARIDKLGGGALQRLLLMGESPASLLLGWDSERWRGRAAGPQRVEGLGFEILLLPGLTEMLGNPGAKRLAWQYLVASSTTHA